MNRAYDEIIEFIASGTTPESVARFEPSQETKDCVADLIHKEKISGLTPDESAELDHFMKLEHLMRLAKARARALCTVTVHGLVHGGCGNWSGLEVGVSVSIRA